MVELLHDVDLLVDVLLQEGFLLDVGLADDLHRVHHVRRFYLSPAVLWRASITSPNAHSPIVSIIS